MRRLRSWLAGGWGAPKAAIRRRRIDLGDKASAYILYAIGDVHGCILELRQAEDAIASDLRRSGRPGIVVLLGDYVDRGPSTSDVLDYLCKPNENGLKRVPLCGNHDDLFLNFLRNPELQLEWIALGGAQTLMSYGIDIHHLLSRGQRRERELHTIVNEAVPDAHRHFLASLPVMLKVGPILFVHAGIRPGLPIDQQNDRDLMWIREPFTSLGPALPPLRVVHGHTPRPQPDFGPNRIGIDTGAYETGNLSVLKIDGDEISFL